MNYCYGIGLHNWILFPIFWIVVLFLCFGIWRRPWYGRYGQGRWNRYSADPIDIAKHRYASGEITKDEYETIKKEIGVKHD